VTQESDQTTQNDTQVFILRLWQERREIKDAASPWRGVIEHLPSGQHQHIKDLSGVTNFIIELGKKSNFKLPTTWCQWFINWLCVRKRNSLKNKPL
jgi:hypothetical protein